MYSLKQKKKRRGTEKTQRFSNQVPHKLREIDVSMVKVMSTARRAVAVRCIGCVISSFSVTRGLPINKRPKPF